MRIRDSKALRLAVAVRCAVCGGVVPAPGIAMAHPVDGRPCHVSCALDLPHDLARPPRVMGGAR